MITIQKGNPYVASIKITNKDGTAYYLTGKNVLFTIKYLYDDSDNDDKDMKAFDKASPKDGYNLITDPDDLIATVIEINMRPYLDRINEIAEGINAKQDTVLSEVASLTKLFVTQYTKITLNIRFLYVLVAILYASAIYYVFQLLYILSQLKKLM